MLLRCRYLSLLYAATSCACKVNKNIFTDRISFSHQCLGSFQWFYPKEKFSETGNIIRVYILCMYIWTYKCMDDVQLDFDVGPLKTSIAETKNKMKCFSSVFS